jgi:hypothetical protein
VCLDPLSQCGGGHVAIRAVTADAKVRDTCRRVEPHQFNSERVNAEKASHPVKRGSDAILNVAGGAIASTAECAHQRKLKGRAGEALRAVSRGVRSGSSVVRVCSVAAKKTARRLNHTMANFLERTRD